MTQYKYTVWVAEEFVDEFYAFLVDKWASGDIPDYYFEGVSEED